MMMVSQQGEVGEAGELGAEPEPEPADTASTP
jgi:hypothetical protein